MLMKLSHIFIIFTISVKEYPCTDETDKIQANFHVREEALERVDKEMLKLSSEFRETSSAYPEVA